LRNESPKPLVVEPRFPLTLKNVEQRAAIGQNAEPDQLVPRTAIRPLPNDVLPAQFTNDRAEFGEPASIAQRTTLSMAAQVGGAPPPYPHHEVTGSDINKVPLSPEANWSEGESPVRTATSTYAFPKGAGIETGSNQPRLHVVVDGDSLARLAGRYLDDPQRANEIFELNRNLLSDPELLPIGAEIAIPASSTRFSGGDAPQSLLPDAASIHAASRGGLIPVRPIPSTTAVMPRAQLARPLPVAGTLRVP
jgi:hypothetical protein